jgi:hypothetical protein
MVHGFSSCSTESDFNGSARSDIHVKLKINPPFFLKQTVTEGLISEIQALIFVDTGNGYAYQYTASTSLIDQEGLSASFDVIMYTTDYPVKVYVIANANGDVLNNPPLVGDSENEVKQKLKQSFTPNNNTTNFPMWSEHVFQSGVSAALNNTSLRIKALRAIARVDVIATSVQSNFEITDIRVFRANSQIQLVPNTYTGDLLVSAPSIPNNSTNTIQTLPILTGGNISQSQLYLPESLAPLTGEEALKATCIVVGGKYKGSATTTYYRLDFKPNLANYPFGQVLRNHHYTFNITDVDASGWGTPEDAASNLSSHITADVVDWVDTPIEVDIYPDGQRHFILSTILVNVGGNSKLVGIIEYDTNIKPFGFRWSNAAGVAIGERAETLEGDYFKISKSDNGYHINIESLTDNPVGNGDIVAYFLIEADRLRILITVTQHEKLS